MLARACNAIPPVFLRANTLARPRQARGRADGAEGRNALMATLRRDYNLASRASSLSPWGVELVGGRPPTGLRLAAWEQGMFEVQDVGSQVVAMATNASRGDLVVDFCAGNGGKTLAMAAMVGREGLVVAHDVEVLRLKQLCGSLARARVHPDSVQVGAVGLACKRSCLCRSAALWAHTLLLVSVLLVSVLLVSRGPVLTVLWLLVCWSGLVPNGCRLCFPGKKCGWTRRLGRGSAILRYTSGAGDGPS